MGEGYYEAEGNALRAVITDWLSEVADVHPDEFNARAKSAWIAEAVDTVRRYFCRGKQPDGSKGVPLLTDLRKYLDGTEFPSSHCEDEPRRQDWAEKFAAGLENCARYDLCVPDPPAFASHVPRVKEVLRRYYERSLELKADAPPQKRKSAKQGNGGNVADTDSSLVRVGRRDFGRLLAQMEDHDVLWWLYTFYDGGHLKDIERTLKQRRNGHVRFLVFDGEWCPTSEMRKVEIGLSPSHAVYVAALVALSERLPGQVEVRTYRDLPCAPMFLLERNGECVFGYSSYLLCGRAMSLPYLEWGSKHELAQEMLTYVRTKWDRWDPELNATGLAEENPSGHWIYCVDPNMRSSPERTKIYGHFFVFHEGKKWRANGEAFYYGCPPRRSETRRGFWRSTKVAWDRESLEIDYDMLVQNKDVKAPNEDPQYEGGFGFTHRIESTNPALYKLGFHGSLRPKEGGFGGATRAVKLSSPEMLHRQPGESPEYFAAAMKRLFEGCFGEIVF